MAETIGSYAVGDGSIYGFIVQNDPINWVDPWGLARFGKRPLGNLPFMINGPTDDALNTEISHEHIWFDDNQGPSNIGFGPDGLFTELDTMKSRYKMSPEYFDDDLLREAYKNIPPGTYCRIGNNCQDWAERVRDEYKRLEREKKKPCK